MDFSKRDAGKLTDLDKVMCYITGKDYNKILRITDTVDHLCRGMITGKWSNTEFFKIKIYKKGSIHLEFLDKWLWKEFNMRACKLKNWLPKGEWEDFQKEKKAKQEQENILKLN